MVENAIYSGWWLRGSPSRSTVDRRFASRSGWLRARRRTTKKKKRDAPAALQWDDEEEEEKGKQNGCREEKEKGNAGVGILKRRNESESNVTHLRVRSFLIIKLNI